MAGTAGTLSLCFQEFQVGLTNYLKASAPSELWPLTGMYQQIMSQANDAAGARALLQNAEDTQDGKDYFQLSSGKPVMKLKYEKCRITDSTYDDTTANYCVDLSPEGDPYGYVDATIAKHYMSQPIEITDVEFANLDETPSQRIILRMAQEIKSIMLRVNADWVAKVKAATGLYHDGTSSVSAPRRLNIMNDEGKYNPQAFVNVQLEYMVNGFSGRPIGVAGQRMYRALAAEKNVGMGAYNVPVSAPNIGVDVALDFTMDATINNTEENFLTWMPRTIFPLRWTKNVGYQAKNLEMHKAGTVSYLGEVFDVTVATIGCPLRTVITIEKWIDLFTPIDAMYGCGWKKGVLNHTLGCGPDDCETTGNIS